MSGKSDLFRDLYERHKEDKDMAWLTVNKYQKEEIFQYKPISKRGFWYAYNRFNYFSAGIDLPNGTIEKILGHELTFENSPIEIV